MANPSNSCNHPAEADAGSSPTLQALVRLLARQAARELSAATAPESDDIQDTETCDG